MYKLVKSHNSDTSVTVKGFLICTNEAWDTHIQKAKEYFRYVDGDENDNERTFVFYIGDHGEAEIYGYNNYIDQFTVEDIDGIDLGTFERTFHLEVNNDYYLNDSRFGTVALLYDSHLDDPEEF